MLRGLWRLAWLEIKIFLREPLGAIGSIAIPVVAFVIMSRVGGPQLADTPGVPRFIAADLPIFAGLLTLASAVLSFVAIIAIYREGGILKRLRATPLRPYTILTAHVLVKLLFTAITLVALIVAGRRVYPAESGVPIVSFAVALLYCTLCILALGFLIASLVPTARFAQPIGRSLLQGRGDFFDRGRAAQPRGDLAVQFGETLPQLVMPGEFAEAIRAMHKGVTYANVHTDLVPSGEIRSKVDPP